MIEQSARYLPALDAAMRDLVQSVPDAPGFRRMLEYTLGWVDAEGMPLAGGGKAKRVRPLLLLLCAEVSGGDWRAALPAAAAVEILHNFSLIHDDIEDASPMRHGLPTAWKQWGLAAALNAGDAMFALAYVALERLNETVSPATALHAWSVFNQMALALTRGQHLDISFETRASVSVADYLDMIEGKSAALLAASAQLGALVARGSLEAAEPYRLFGLNLGLAFQIRDDILGIWGDPAITGKSAATDIVSRKKSLPALFGLEQSQPLRELYGRDTFGEAEVTQAVALLDEAGARDYAETLEARYHERALAAIDSSGMADSSADALAGLLSTLLGRTA